MPGDYSSELSSRLTRLYTSNMAPAAMTTELIESTPKIWKVREPPLIPCRSPKFAGEELVTRDGTDETMFTVVCSGTTDVTIEITVVFV